MKDIIGIVGGVGPYAGLDLVRKIFDQTTAKNDQDHIPVSLFSFPELIPDRTEFLLNNNCENPGVPIAEIIKLLYKNGAKTIGIPCNTAHSPIILKCLFDNLKKDNIEINFVNMIEETAIYINEKFPNIKNVGLLSTTGTLKTNIYNSMFKTYNLEIITVSNEIQNQFVQPAIYDKEFGIKAFSNPINPKATKNINHGALSLKEMGAEAIILGCTELPLAISTSLIVNLPTIDPTMILARALIKKVAPEKLKS